MRSSTCTTSQLGHIKISFRVAQSILLWLLPMTTVLAKYGSSIGRASEEFFKHYLLI